MEIPTLLKKLYRHWDFHTENKIIKGENFSKVSKKYQENNLHKKMMEIDTFVNERMCIWDKKTIGGKPPYTKDSVLSTYRFCNIFRELDRQTIEFHTLLNPLRDNFPLWLLNMFYCRMVAKTETIQKVGLLSFNKEENKRLYKRLMNSPRPRFGTPYVFPVSVILKSKTPTRELCIAKYLPEIVEQVASEICTWKRKAVCDGLHSVISIFGYKLNFLWTEVLIDTAYQFPQYIDLFGHFPVGPGSLPTIRDLDKGTDPSQVVEELAQLRKTVGLTYNKKQVLLSAENWEGIGCEYRKYSNLKNGKGRKRLFQQ
jgi:alpha-glutamyl/putrescinyl thymine pyrophosphorylase clade 1